MKESDPDVWKAMVAFARENTGEWGKIYHLRSYVETIFSAIKTRIRRKQLALKVLAYNIKQMLYDETAIVSGVPYRVEC